MTSSFHDALERAVCPLIAEIKPSSPKVGPLLAKRSVSQIADDYLHAGAPCLSVTTGAWHKGNIGMVSEMAATGLPVLRKDFITSQRHLDASKEAGASAVLLTCTLLRRADILRLAEAALAMGLTPFVEAANAKELDGLMLPSGAILAINNRDIRAQETDDGGIEQSEALFDLAKATHRGLLVSASGLLSPSAVTRAMDTGFDGVLVGTALLSGERGIQETTKAYLNAAGQKAGLFA
ncbi:indole-3-glycerol-phosphate synthase [Pacificoceanicola onchidii]|uniref:indole-3-glycerol-phosphate synthase n=1 Tax=Pacificoceanicola onchidii TaxID=2562685 RepID=UPI0010A63CA2|nr:indole-3-glycerol-phosphate synthase [Pacificoceanicola onchidii]